MANPLVHRPLDDLKIAAQTINGDDGHTDVYLSQLPPARMLNLRLDVASAGTAKQALEEKLWTNLPTTANTRSSNGMIWWLGPDEWMITKPTREDDQQLEATVTEALGDVFHSLVDVSHQFEGFRVRGPLARDLLAHVVTLDLHPRVCKANSVMQTVAAHCTVTLLVGDDGASFDIYTRRSFVQYIWKRLVDAAADMDLAIEAAA